MINRGEFALESEEIKELFLHIVRRAKVKYSFKLRNFIIMDNHIHLLIKPVSRYIFASKNTDNRLQYRTLIDCEAIVLVLNE